MTKTRWPLYLTIAVAAAASMATSPPPSWIEARVFQGANVRLDQTRATDDATFTVHVSKDYADPWESYSPSVDVVGLVKYELGDAPQDLRLALVTPDGNVLAEQIHSLEGAGRFYFSLEMWEPFTCQAGAKVCDQTMTVEFDAGSVPTGAVDIEWYLRATTSGEGTETPGDLVFDVELPDGQAISYVPDLNVADPVVDEIGDGRWRMGQSGTTWLYLSDSPREIQRFSVRGDGTFASSALSLTVSLSNSQIEPVDLRVAVRPDQPDAAVLAEEIVTMSGNSAAKFELKIPEPLDCPEGACKRSFQIVLDSADQVPVLASAIVYIDAVLDGEGEQPPADVELVLEVDDPNAM